MTDRRSETSVHEVKGFRRILIRLLAQIIRIWQKTLRMKISPESRAALEAADTGILFLVWHNRLFSSLEIWHRIRSGNFVLHGLVSASRDGAKLAALLEDLGVVPVRGSSSRRSVPSTHRLIKILRSRGDVGITVDGPRGPCYTAQPGAALLARQTHVPIVLYAGHCRQCLRFKSWDRFELPLPFSRVDVHAEYLPPIREWEGDTSREEVRQVIENKLLALTGMGRVEKGRPV